MSLIERIKEIQTIQASKEAARLSVIEKERLANEAAQRQKNIDQEKRLTYLSQQTERILNESGVLKEFNRIEKELLQNKFKNHSVIYNHSQQGVWLVWSNKDFKYVPDCTVGGRDGISGDDYFYIHAEVEVDSETIAIKASSEKRLSKSEWSNKDVFEDVLVYSFINPGYHFYYNDHDSYDGGNC